MTEPALTPVESMVLTVARSQSGRGDAVPPNTAAALVMTVDRLAEDNDRLRLLLAPFAAVGDAINEIGYVGPDEWPLWNNTTACRSLTVGDMRRAAALLDPNTEEVLTTRTGKVLTDGDIEALAAEAEQGYVLGTDRSEASDGSD